MEKVLSEKEKELGQKQFTPRDFTLMCKWLEIKGNVESVKGSDGKTKVGARYPNKKLAFGGMAIYINKNQNRGSDLVPIDFQGARNRYNNQMLKYKRAKNLEQDTGWGLTPEDERAEIHTLEAKLAKVCPCYAQLDVIMQGHPEVDVGGNLFNASSISNVDGTMPVDILSSVGAGGPNDEDSVVEEVEVGSNVHATHVQHDREHDGSTSQSPTVEVIDLEHNPEPSLAAPQSIPAAPPRTPTVRNSVSLNGTAVESGNDDISQPPSTTVHLDPTPTKQKVSRFTSAKKRPSERNGSLSGTFATSMESLSDGKQQGNLIKERELEAKLAAIEHDRSVRSKNSTRQLEIDVEKLKHEQKRMEHSTILEGKRLEQAQRSEDRKLELQEKKAKMQARISLMKVCRHRTPEEIEKLLALMESNVE